jgi:uncharacterized protein (DUF4415 family)
MRVKEVKPRITLRPNTKHIISAGKDAAITQQPEVLLFSDLQMVSTHVQKVGEPVAFSSEFARSNFYKPRKREISIRIDEEELAWFKNQPGKYQQRINEVCRAHILANLAPPQ